LDSSVNSISYSKSGNALLPLILFELVFILLFMFNQYLAIAGILGLGVVILLFFIPRYALFLAIAIAYSGVASSVLQGLFLPTILLTIVAWFMNFIKEKKLNFRAAEQNGLFLILLIWMLCSTLYARDVEAGFVDIYIYFKYLIVYFLLINILNDWSEIRELLWVLVATGISMLVYALYAFMTATEFMGVRLISFIDDPNSFAIKLVPLVIFCYVLFKIEKAKILKLIALISGSIITVSIVLTLSRGGWLALMAVYALIIWEEMKNKKLLLFSGCFVLLIFAVLFLPEDMVVFRFGKLSKIGMDASIVQRLRILKGGVQMFFDHPFLGVGVGNFVNYCADYSGLIIGLVAHNSFLHIAAELGILGLIIFTLLFTSTIRHLRQEVRYFHDSKNVYYIKGLIFSLIGFTIHSMFLSEQYNIVFFLIVALTIIIYYKIPSEDKT
jgi:putative inorganic carbon (HCO3(-)) transporter